MNELFSLLSSNTFLLLFLCNFIALTSCSDDLACLRADVSISCGAAGSSATQNGGEWVGDMDPRFSSYARIKGFSTSSSTVDGSLSADPIPYGTARVSGSEFSYTFLVGPGQKFIRLHFNPSRNYKGFLNFKDLFTVRAGPFTLLSNFSASLTATALGLGSIVKEFCIYIEEIQQLTVIFSPEYSRTGSVLAFINGIEVIHVPYGNSYFIHDGGNLGAQIVGHKSQLYHTDSSSALEIVHRLNVEKDGAGVTFRMQTTVPKEELGMRKNRTWKMSVNTGFRYLLRLHFSDLGIKSMAENGSLVFKLLINDVNANGNMNLVEWGGDSMKHYKDYIVVMKGLIENGKLDLFIYLQWYDELVKGHGPFLGFEVLRLSNLLNSLAIPNPLPPAQKSQPSWIVQKLLSLLGHGSGVTTVFITLMAIVNIIVHKLREVFPAVEIEEENKPSDRAKRFCRRFTLAEIKIATENFSDAQIIGKGGFGYVYKGIIDDGRETIAVKRLKSNSSQGANEFLAEIETLSELQHINLLTLIGYCNEIREMILIYECMPCGTLADQLYKLARRGDSCTPLTWKQRLNICIGAGRGLDYLHTGCAVIHRDVKSTNILLDKNFTAKVSDFGLVKHENINDLQSHISTKVMGTFGYLDPNYHQTGRLTNKSDVYAFGVVLLEVLCGRPALDFSVAPNEESLVKWALEKIGKGEVELIIASNLRQEITADSLEAFVEIVKRCLDDEPKKRASMAQVVLQLEFALERQEVIESSDSKGIKGVDPVYEHPAMASITEHTPRYPTTPPNEQTEGKLDSDDLSYGINVVKSSLWNKLNPFRRNKISGSESYEANTNLIEFEWAAIKSSTRNFAVSNTIAKSTYRATFHTGKQVSVEVFTSIAEFNKKILLLRRFDHPNIVKLLGYSRHKDKRALVFEYLKNKSLDNFIFGPMHLEWKERFEIIMGIARGLAYLHSGIGLRVIHKDIRARKILLDKNMKPKVSGVGQAYTSFSFEESIYESMLTDTKQFYNGHVCPEYLMSGKLSTRTDVFSFGVLVLEIISGKTAGPCERDGLSLLVRAGWSRWLEDQALHFMDDSIALIDPVDSDEFLRCLKVGLLCTQLPSERPTMGSVIQLLKGESMSIELPLVNPWDVRSWSKPYSDVFQFDYSSVVSQFDVSQLARLINLAED